MQSKVLDGRDPPGQIRNDGGLRVALGDVQDIAF
jgi:hypothetical protein